MNKRYLVLLFIISLLSGCSAIDELTMFDIELTSQYTIPSSTLLDLPFSIITPEVTTNSESEFENNNTRTDLVESVQLTEITLNLESPQSGNFNFLNEIEIRIQAEDLPEVLIASRSNIPEDGNVSVSLETTNEELREYIQRDTYQLRVTAVTDGTINQDHVIEIVTVFSVDAEILGI